MSKQKIIEIMKKVVFEQHETINIDEINDGSYIGLIAVKGKTIIAKDNKGFFGYAKNDIDFTSKWHKDTVKEYIKEISVDEVFLFETKTELFDWFYKD